MVNFVLIKIKRQIYCNLFVLMCLISGFQSILMQKYFFSRKALGKTGYLE